MANFILFFWVDICYLIWLRKLQRNPPQSTTSFPKKAHLNLKKSKSQNIAVQSKITQKIAEQSRKLQTQSKTVKKLQNSPESFNSVQNSPENCKTAQKIPEQSKTEDFSCKMKPLWRTYLARSSASSASNLSLHAKNVSTVTGSPCGTTI